jgi:hypothetical protein
MNQSFFPPTTTKLPNGNVLQNYQPTHVVDKSIGVVNHFSNCNNNSSNSNTTITNTNNKKKLHCAPPSNKRYTKENEVYGNYYHKIHRKENHDKNRFNNNTNTEESNSENNLSFSTSAHVLKRLQYTQKQKENILQLFDEEFSKTSSITESIVKIRSINGFDRISYKNHISRWKKVELLNGTDSLVSKRGRKVNEEFRKSVLEKLRKELILDSLPNFQNDTCVNERLKKVESGCYSYDMVRKAALIAQKEWLDALLDSDDDKDEIENLKFSPGWIHGFFHQYSLHKEVSSTVHDNENNNGDHLGSPTPVQVTSQSSTLESVKNNFKNISESEAKLLNKSALLKLLKERNFVVSRGVNENVATLRKHLLDFGNVEVNTLEIFGNVDVANEEVVVTNVVEESDNVEVNVETVGYQESPEMTSDNNDENVDDNIKYCKCKKTYDQDKSFMIECSSKTKCKADCNGWFHAKCMGILNIRKIPKDWICPVCEFNK